MCERVPLCGLQRRTAQLCSMTHVHMDVGCRQAGRQAAPQLPCGHLPVAAVVSWLQARPVLQCLRKRSLCLLGVVLRSLGGQRTPCSSVWIAGRRGEGSVRQRPGPASLQLTAVGPSCDTRESRSGPNMHWDRTPNHVLAQSVPRGRFRQRHATARTLDRQQYYKIRRSCPAPPGPARARRRPAAVHRTGAPASPATRAAPRRADRAASGHRTPHTAVRAAVPACPAPARGFYAGVSRAGPVPPRPDAQTRRPVTTQVCVHVSSRHGVHARSLRCV